MDARPQLVLFDVFETLLALEPLRQRFVHIGRPPHELELFFARTLRDGMALTLAGDAPPFAEVARAALRTTSGHTLEDAALSYVLDGFAELPAQPDAEPAIRRLIDAGVPAYAFTHGGVRTATAALQRAELTGLLRGVLSAESLRSFKPPARVYRWAAAQVGLPPECTALVAVHSWDVHGAVRAGLLAGFATRLEGAVPVTVDVPHAVGERLDEVIEELLALPE